jgi:hypothetical protein
MTAMTNLNDIVVFLKVARRFVPAKLQACLEALRAWRSPLWISDPTRAHNL